jgi:hypothetical protein
MAAARDELRAVAGRFPRNVPIQEVYAGDMFNQIARGIVRGDIRAPSRAREELRRLARDFPESLKIQELSTEAGIYMSELVNKQMQMSVRGKD